MEKKINVVYQDALELTLSEELRYDLIFSDAIILASYTARALSSFINYLINKYKVFRYKKREPYYIVINVTLLTEQINISTKVRNHQRIAR